MNTDLDQLTPLQQTILSFFLCDPFITFDEALNLAGINQREEDEKTYHEIVEEIDSRELVGV